MLAKEEMKVPYLSIKQLMEKLPKERFMQVHRMCVVNLDYIDCIDTVNGLINLKNGETAEVGVTYKNKLIQVIKGKDN